ncbi:hypothetical protein [Nostoc sp.]
MRNCKLAIAGYVNKRLTNRRGAENTERLMVKRKSLSSCEEGCNYDDE